VGQKVPTSIGLYDISGNIWEWCYEDSGQEHVMRGGSWRDGASYLQIGNASEFPRPDPVTPRNLWDLSDSEYKNDPNYYGINLIDSSLIPGIGKTPLKWLIDKHNYNPTVPDPALGGNFTHYDPTLDPNLVNLDSLVAFIRTYDPGYPDPPNSNVAKEEYFDHFGDSSFASSVSGFPYNQDYATRYDPRFDSRNPHYSYFAAVRDGYDEDTGRKGDTIGFRIIRNQGSF
jgi:hypothetical protein